MSKLSILNEIEVMPMNNMLIIEPNLIKKTDSSQYYGMNWYSKSVFYKGIGIKPKLSNDLFNLDKNIWNSVIQSKYADSDFTFDNEKAVILRGSIIEILSKDSFVNDTLENFLSIVKNNASESYFNTFETLTVIFKQNKAVLIMSLNFKNSWYSLHSGLFDNNTYVLFPNPDIETSSLAQFMYQFNESFADFKNNISVIADKGIEYLGFDFNEKLSLREIFDIVIKDMKCSIDIDEDGNISSISGMSTKNSNILVNFFNSFGLTFKSLKKLSYLRKTCRVSDISVGEMLRIISEEINSETLSINGYTIANVCNICSTEEFDKRIINEELK